MWLGLACKALRSAVSASKWPPWSPLPVIAEDGAVSEPPSGRFSATCHPRDGGAGIQAALDACEEGGTILLEEGIYDFLFGQCLLINRRVHVFGRGTAILNFTAFTRDSESEEDGFDLHFITCTSSVSLDRVRIVTNTDFDEVVTISIVDGGRLRLQQCEISAEPYAGFYCIRVSGPTARAELLECQISVGVRGIIFDDRSTGFVYGCNITNFLAAGINICDDREGVDPIATPCSIAIARNTFSDCEDCGVYVGGEIDALWTVGEGNVFRNCTQDVLDERFEDLVQDQE